MEKKISVKLMSLFLVITMMIGLVPMYIFAAGSVTNYDDFLALMKQLEVYADEYAAMSYRDPGELVLNFVRTGVERYQDSSWSTIAGDEITGFTTYVETQDAENGTNVMDLRDIVVEDFYLPNGNQVDFGHMFGTMNISYVAKGSADLSGWAGDLCDLLYYCVSAATVPEGTVEEMAAYILENCFGEDADNAFGWDDFYGDMDAYYLIAEYNKGNGSFSTLMEDYFTSTLSDVDRAVYFVNNRFAVEDSQEAVRKAIYESYSADLSIKLLESSRGLTGENTLRKACCYAFADYLYSQAKGNLIAGTEDDEETDNDYYSVFSTAESILAPGISQEIKYAQTVDGKQIVYYVATVDVTRDDVTIMANYKDNDPSKGWGYQRVADQAAALVKNYSSKTDENGNKLYENFNAIVATNADGYNMSTGEPGGLLVMDGQEWHAVDKDGFFAILNDGSAMIGTQEDYETYKHLIRDAVGGFGAVLIKDGKINVTKNANYTATRASRTAVGIKEDGSVVMMVLDGRQQPFSAGGAIEEIAQIMLDAGCVHAINLDGGGSTTYLSKPAGSDELQLVNRPSDGFARSVSTSLVAISTAKSSNEFDSAILSSGYDYITAGTTMQFEATGVSNTGNSAPIPEGAYWQVTNETVGTIDETGLFTAVSEGDVTVEYIVNGEVAGSKEIHVVIPNGIKFAADRIVAIYGIPTELSLSLWYDSNPVAYTAENDVVIMLEHETAGTIDGVTFTADEASGIRTVMVGAILNANVDLAAFSTINIYREDEALFDFDNATMGNRTLAWNREVTNARTADNQLYRIVDPEAPIEVEYTFALDMTTIEIPAQVEPLKSMLPGADAENASAWNFLLQLAERVCVQTNVKITADFSPDLDVNIDELKVINDFFELTSAEIDENNHLTIVCHWRDQTAAIDAATANPLCILTGIYATVKDDASYSNNEILISNNGYVSYDVYLAASQLYSFATDPANDAQNVYGLYPYIHEPPCRDSENNADGTLENKDKGAHFASQYAEFADVYVINSEIRQGWIEDSYYVDNVEVTGVQFIPSKEDRYLKNFYEFDENGILVKTLSGFIEYEGDLYYAMNGVPQKGWQSFNVDDKEVYYYFDLKTYKAVNGEQQIYEGLGDGIPFTYTFDNYILVKGDLREYSYTDKQNIFRSGLGYRWGGEWTTGKWFDIEDDSYYIQKYQYIVDTGFLYKSPTNQDVPYDGYYLFDENGVFQKNFTGIYNDYYVENGIAYGYTKRIVEIDGYYYLVNGDLKILKDGKYWVSHLQTGGYVTAGQYEFDAEGRMITPVVTVEEVTAQSQIDYTVAGSLVTVTETTVPCKVGYLENGVYVPITAVENEDGTYSYLVPGGVTKVLLIVAGDVSCDGVFDAEDKDLLAKALVPGSATELTAEQIFAADVNGNGTINSADKVLIARSLLPEGHALKKALTW
ncbi:MAG: phosphodiester glycosidase family protein [Clostridia bacterium]|nr:phosphodiester glycosidase family protein [Clostridia bacterium]